MKGNLRNFSAADVQKYKILPLNIKLEHGLWFVVEYGAFLHL